jgi:hypothetical protein
MRLNGKENNMFNTGRPLGYDFDEPIESLIEKYKLYISYANSIKDMISKKCALQGHKWGKAWKTYEEKLEADPDRFMGLRSSGGTYVLWHRKCEICGAQEIGSPKQDSPF